MLVHLEALRVPLVSSLAGASASASSRASPTLTATLAVFRNSTAACSARGNGDIGVSRRVGGAAAEFAVDEGQCLLSVHGTVALVGVSIVAVAAVGISGIAVALDLACGWALETRWAGGELYIILAVAKCEKVAIRLTPLAWHDPTL